MKNLVLVTAMAGLLAIACILPGRAQAIKSKPLSTRLQALPLDPAVRTGKLPNGFTYYIRRNTEPKNRVLLYLANKVGSILENDDQRGLAHFMEHMNFNGTRHFPKNELVSYLQKAGVKFGADINAYTSFDETVYQLPVPADKPDVLKNSIDIMHDWAQGALIETAEVDRERGVVLEEKRLGKGAAERIQRQYLPLVLNQSRYGQRLPIGLDAVLETFRPETLRQFYHDWYRPDLQALVVVGDIDVDQIETTIRTQFADLKNPANEKPRPHYSIPLTGKNQFIAVTDKEEVSTTIQVLMKHRATPIKTAADYRQFTVRQLVNLMLSTRYQALTTQANPPFIYGAGGISKFLGGLATFSVTVRAKPGELEHGFKAAWRETERANRYGFTQPELDRTKKAYLNRLESSLENKAKTNSVNYVNEYVDYFLRGDAAPGIDTDYALTQKDLSTITLADVNSRLKAAVKPTDRDIVVTAPEKEKSALPGRATVEGWIQAVQVEKLTPYGDDFMDKPLLSTPPVAGSIVSEKVLDSLNATELTLSNGASVILKKTDFQNNDIHFKAFSPGGSSLYGDADYQSAVYAGYLTTMAGIGPYNFQQLGKYFADKRMGLGLYINDYSEGIDGFSTSKDLENLLQVVYLYFTEPKSDTAAFRSLIAVSKASLANRSNSPGSVFDDTVSAVLGNYNVRRSGPSPEKLAQINLDRSHAIFRERFADASDFTFALVGDFDEKQVRPLIERYIGSLPATNRPEQAKDLGIHPPAGMLMKIVRKGLEPKASVRLVFSGAYRYDASANKIMDALADVLQIRLIERLREKESGVYSPSVFVGYTKQPAQRYSLSVSFGCAPEHVDELIASALDEIDRLKTNGPDEQTIDKVKAENRLRHETQLRTNFFWAEYFTKQILNRDDVNQILHVERNLQQVTKQSLQTAALNYLSGQNLIRLILLPETGVSRKQ